MSAELTKLRNDLSDCWKRAKAQVGERAKVNEAFLQIFGAIDLAASQTANTERGSNETEKAPATRIGGTDDITQARS